MTRCCCTNWRVVSCEMVSGRKGKELQRRSPSRQARQCFRTPIRELCSLVCPRFHSNSLSPPPPLTPALSPTSLATPSRRTPTAPLPFLLSHLLRPPALIKLSTRLLPPQQPHRRLEASRTPLPYLTPSFPLPFPSLSSSSRSSLPSHPAGIASSSAPHHRHRPRKDCSLALGR